MKLINGMEFVNDPSVVGKWEFWDKLTSIKEFNPEKPMNPDASYDFKTVYFLPNGQNYWIFEGWTKGILLIHYGGDDPVLEYKYETRSVDEDLFMFIAVTDDEGKHIVVMKKSDNHEYALSEIKKTENIDLPFSSDERVLGKWKSIAFVDKISDFMQGRYDKNITLWLKEIEFYKDGVVVRRYMDEEWPDTWTKGFLLDHKKSIASAYSFHNFDGKEYMFLEWKMGNYVYGGMPASYYVFKRS